MTAAEPKHIFCFLKTPAEPYVKGTLCHIQYL